MKIWACGILFNVLFVAAELKGKICALTAQNTPRHCAPPAAPSSWLPSPEAETIGLLIAKQPLLFPISSPSNIALFSHFEKIL